MERMNYIVKGHVRHSSAEEQLQDELAAIDEKLNGLLLQKAEILHRLKDMKKN